MEKRFLHMLLLTAVLILALSLPAFAGGKTVKLHIPDMCASNEIQAQTVLGEMNGVSAVETDLGEYIATVTFDDAITSVEAVKDTLAGISLMVESVEEVQ